MVTLNQDVTQPHRFSVANHWVDAEPVKSANFKNFPSPLYIKLPPQTTVVSAVPLSHPAYFSEFYNPNTTSWFPVTGTPTPAVCNPFFSMSHGTYLRQ